MKTPIAKTKKPTVTKPPLIIETSAGEFALEVFRLQRVRLSRPGTILFLEHGESGHKGWHLQRVERQTGPFGKVASVEQIIAAFVAWKEAHPRIFSMLEKLAQRDVK